MHELLYKVNEEYRNCDLCSLSKNRAEGKPVAFGNGYSDALGLLITGAPVFNDVDHPVPYGEDTEPGKSLKAIWELAKIDPADWYHVPAFMCPSEGTLISDKVGVEACQDRLKKVVHAVSPAIVVTSGPTALRAFFGIDNAVQFLNRYGPIPCENYIAISTHCLVEYHYKLDKGIDVSDMSYSILKHWENIASLVANIKKKC